jgi:hypothetical protein
LKVDVLAVIAEDFEKRVVPIETTAKKPGLLLIYSQYGHPTQLME